MSKLKDKLSDNMRMVKANQGHAASEPAKGAPTTHTSKPASETPAGAGRKPAGGVATSESSSGDVPQSGTELFPSRVWPD